MSNRKDQASDASELQGKELERFRNAVADLRGWNEFKRMTAATVLGDISAEVSCRVLLEALEKEKSAAVRRYIVTALSRQAPPEAAPALAARLRGDENDGVREVAAFALAHIPSATSLEALGEALKDHSVGVREGAAISLGAIGGERELALLEAVLLDKSEASSVRRYVSASIDKIRQRTSKTVNA